jgi:hypothetical protein
MTRGGISTAIVILIGSLLSNAQAAVDEHTIALWLFNEGNGDTVADASGHGHDGVFNGSPEWVKAEYGNGLQFPGVGICRRGQ